MKVKEEGGGKRRRRREKEKWKGEGEKKIGRERGEIKKLAGKWRRK